MHKLPEKPLIFQHILLKIMHDSVATG